MPEYGKPITQWDIDDIEERLQTIENYLDNGTRCSHRNGMELFWIAKRAAGLFRYRELNDATS